jgi:hypothetical protein
VIETSARAIFVMPAIVAAAWIVIGNALIIKYNAAPCGAPIIEEDYT